LVEFGHQTKSTKRLHLKTIQIPLTFSLHLLKDFELIQAKKDLHTLRHTKVTLRYINLTTKYQQTTKHIKTKQVNKAHTCEDGWSRSIRPRDHDKIDDGSLNRRD